MRVQTIVFNEVVYTKTYTTNNFILISYSGGGYIWNLKMVVHTKDESEFKGILVYFSTEWFYGLNFNLVFMNYFA